MKRTLSFVFAAGLLLVALSTLVSGSTPRVLAQAPALNVVQTDAGQIAPARDSTADVRIFKMIPFAAPPVGDLRWKPPQPVTPWQGIRRADVFSPLCMQTGAYAFNSTSYFYMNTQGSSEDCLYLNVWTAAKTPMDKLPVMFLAYSGSNTGSGSTNPIVDGTGVAKKGVVYVSAHYRLGALGFLAHPDLTKESGANKASGNYALMDEIAALKWVQKNIAAFGGEPNNVTLIGSLAGALNFCDLTASPLAKGLFHRATGDSRGCWYYGVGPVQPLKLAAAEQAGADFAKKNFNASTIAELRAVSAWDLVKPAAPYTRIVDGYVIPDYDDVTYAKGLQNDVPILVGWNKDEATAGAPMATTVVSYTAAAQTRFGKFADQFLKVYPATTDAEAVAQSYALVRDNYAWSVWEWAKAHNATGKTKVYIYYWTHALPWLPGVKFAEQDPATKLGASGGSEFAYAFRTLDIINPWGAYLQYTDADYKLSDIMSSYWVNFAKTGDPNGPGLPVWPVFDEKAANPVIYLDTQIQPGPVPNKTGLDSYEAFYNSLRAPAQ